MNRKPLILLIASAIVIGGVVLFFFNPFAGRALYLTLPGTVKIQEVRLGSKIGGRVAQVTVDEGTLVYPGQVLVLLEAPELESQRDQWKAKMEAAKAEMDKAIQGARVEEKAAAAAAAESAKAQYERMKAGWRQEEKRQAAADLQAAEADFNQAREDFDRVAELYSKKTIARAEYDQAFANRGRASGKANALKARVEMLQTGNRPEDKEQAYQEWKKAQANYELLRITRQEDVDLAKARYNEAKAKLAEIEINYAEREIKAPEKAVVEVVGVRKGDLVAPNQPVVRVLRAEDLWVEVFVPETELGKLRLGQEAEVQVNSHRLKQFEGQEVDVRVDAYPSKSFKGKVIQVASISEYTPRNVQSIDERHHQVFAVKVRIADPQGVFKAGMAAEVRLPLAEAP